MRVVVVGAGLAGSVAARLLSDRGHHVEVFESRPHVGGNCHDSWRHGILVHEYGPHGFHTDKKDVWDFVRRFSNFREVAFEVMANTRAGLIPVPFNDVSAEIAGDLSPEEIRDLIFTDYSEKHWGIPWERIPTSITSRVPRRRHGRDCRYHLDRWQGIPEHGYTEWFHSVLEGIPVHLACPEEAWRRAPADHVIYTGSIDDYFKHRHGKLEYRSLAFEHRVERKRTELQINECNDWNPWTRSVDHSHWLGQDTDLSVITREFPEEWNGSNQRFYPKPFGPNPSRFRTYWSAAKAESRTTFVGRLATYKYIDMDDTIAQVMRRLQIPSGIPSTDLVP